MSVDPVRDTNLARKFIENAMAAAGWHDDTFEDECLTRLQKGMEEYGEAQFMEPDVSPVHEAVEETADGVNWSMLQWQRDRLNGDMTGAEHLAMAAAYFTLARMTLRQYAVSRRN